jgi:hypothetical protein
MTSEGAVRALSVPQLDEHAAEIEEEKFGFGRH